MKKIAQHAHFKTLREKKDGICSQVTQNGLNQASNVHEKGEKNTFMM